MKPKSKAQNPKYDVRSLFEICLKSVRSRICEGRSPKFEARRHFEVCPKSEIKSLSEVRSKSVQSLNSEIYPKYYAQSLTSEDRILKSKIATKIRNGCEKRISKKINQYVIIKNSPTQLLCIQIGQQN